MTTDHVRVAYSTFRKIAPDAYAALSALGQAVGDAGLDKGLTELARLRASQINGCAFCIQFHLNAARRAGVAAAKLDLAAAWRDAGIFSGQERAALAWTEHLTRMASEGAPDQAYAALREQFTEKQAVFLTVTIGTINNWNRIAVALRFAPPIAEMNAA